LPFAVLQGRSAGLTALLLGAGGEEADEEVDYQEGEPGEAHTMSTSATPAAGMKRALEEDGGDVGQKINGGGEDSGAKKAKVA